MAEPVVSNASSTPPSSPAQPVSGSQSATSTPPSSEPTNEKPSAPKTEAEKSRAAIVRALLERRMAKDGTILPKGDPTKAADATKPDEPKTAKPAEATTAPKTTPETHDGKPTEGKVAKQQDKNELDKLAKDASKPPEPEKTEKPAEPKEDPDLVLAKRLSAISRRESEYKARAEQVEGRVKQLENYHGQLTKYNQFLTELPRDPETALKHLGFDDSQLDALYWKLNERAIASQRPPTQEEAEYRQRQIAWEEHQRIQQYQQQQAQQTMSVGLNQARSIYEHRINNEFTSNAAQYPYVKAFGVDTGDIHRWVETEFGRTGKVPMPAEVLSHFEQKLSSRGIEASGNRQIEAPRTEQPNPVVNQTVTSNWSAGAVPVDKTPSQSLRESKEEIKKRLEAGYYNRRP